ncbi:MAG: Dam family site-specific DNA-(adenine-N6)-methyltransferase [Candidatus Hydrogenedentes bacterium]|nr:Dam family site-specific DNA-(adenine-N6)-methyltransferase [Candidatus Hydrogenedentota bacterium]
MNGTRRTLNVPRPFLKWVGGKGQLLGPLLQQVERAGEFGRYHEPFAGGGALFFELFRTNRLGRKRAFLSDTNARLIDAFLAVQEDVDRVIVLLEDHRARHSEEHYYAVRSKVPADLFERAARIIYLNRTCYNGLFRENSKGIFNVPFGRYAKPLICDEVNLRAASAALAHARVEVRPFESVLSKAQEGDLVYFDPPYDPVSRTASFTAYEKGGFGREQQEALAAVASALTEKGVNVILSNSMTPFIRSLYEGRFTIAEVLANRHVNSRADRRGAVSEALIRNF